MTWNGVLGGVLRRKEEENPKEDNKKEPHHDGEPGREQQGWCEALVVWVVKLRQDLAVFVALFHHLWSIILVDKNGGASVL